MLRLVSRPVGGGIGSPPGQQEERDMSQIVAARGNTRRVGVLAVIAVLAALAVHGSAARADGPGSGAPWVASVGDSYISGEAGRWAGNSNNGSGGDDAPGPPAHYHNTPDPGAPSSRRPPPQAAGGSRRGGGHRTN